MEIGRGYNYAIVSVFWLAMDAFGEENEVSYLWGALDINVAVGQRVAKNLN